MPAAVRPAPAARRPPSAARRPPDLQRLEHDRGALSATPAEAGRADAARSCLLKASREAYAQKLAQYNAGLINVVELTNVAYLLYRAETDQLDAQSELLNTLLQKAATNNTLNAFINNF